MDDIPITLTFLAFREGHVITAVIPAQAGIQAAFSELEEA
jgi:hypothetical protein